MQVLLDADYVTRDGKAVVRLFYKTEEGRETLEVEDFKPYIYAIPTEGKLEELKAWAEKLEAVKEVEVVERNERGEAKKVLRVVLTHPGEVPRLRGELKEIPYCEEVREADIPFAERYVIDSGLVPMEGCEATELRICAFDTEVLNPRGQPNPERDPILMIGYADSGGHKRLWTYRRISNSPPWVEFVSNESEVVRRLLETIEDRGVDIILTYNGDNFDFPYLKKRCKRLNLTLAMGFDGSEVKLERRGMGLGARVRGRPHIDLFPICRQVFNLSRYTLEDIYLELFGKEKLSLEKEGIAECWTSGDEEKLRKLLEYCMSDVEATLEIGLALLPFEWELCKLTGELPYQLCRAGAAQRVEALLMRRARKGGILVPNKPPDEEVERREEVSYIGAYVLEPKRGIHDGVLLFDFRSLYPSIIISYNIDPSTLDCKCCEGNGHKTPTGHYFCKRREGFIPRILRELVEERQRVKERLKQAKSKQERILLDAQQHALKILANSMYGYYAFPRARWYSKECAESITALGREYIQQTVCEAKRFGFEVIYGDTDSIYLTIPGASREMIAEKGVEFLRLMNSKLPEAMELEFEGYYPRGLFITKKRYALLDEKGSLVVKGLEMRRRDWANIAKETQIKVLEVILKEKRPERAAQLVREVIKDIREGRVELRDLAIHTQLTRELRDYVQEKAPHITAVKKAMKRGYEFKQGDIISYVITRGPGSVSDKAQLLEFVKDGDYDPDYYINHQILPAVSRILEAVGYTEADLLGKGKQTTLFEF